MELSWVSRTSTRKGAERYARQSVAAFDAAPPDYEAALVRPLQALAQTYLAEQRFASAKEVLARLERLPVSSSRDRALQAGARALIAANEQRWKDAEQEYRLAIGAWETAGEGNAVSAVPELTNLALLYLNQRRLTDAEPLLERAWHIVDRAKDAGNEQRIRVMTDLGVLYGKQGRWSAAAGLLRKAMEIAGAATEMDTPARRRLYETYAEALRRCGQKSAAKA
jgi:tetratricopeptide (TPR) repeat protein